MKDRTTGRSADRIRVRKDGYFILCDCGTHILVENESGTDTCPLCKSSWQIVVVKRSKK